MDVHATTDSRSTGELTVGQLRIEGKRAALVETVVFNQIEEDAGRRRLDTDDRFVIAIEIE